MSLIKTDFGIFDPKKIAFISPIKEKKNERDSFYFTITLDGISDVIWVTGNKIKVDEVYQLILKNLS